MTQLADSPFHRSSHLIDRPVAIMEHRGDPATLGATIQRFIAWRTAAGLHPKTSPTFNVWRSERRPVLLADYSVDLCVGTDQPIEANGELAFDHEGLEVALRGLAEARGWKAGDLFMAIRVAVTGRTATPPLFETLVALGYRRTLERLAQAHRVLSAVGAGT